MRRPRDPHGPGCCCRSCCTQWLRGDLVDDGQPEVVTCIVEDSAAPALPPKQRLLLAKAPDRVLDAGLISLYRAAGGEMRPGTLWHAVPISKMTRTALCGERPTAGFLDEPAAIEIARPTCPRCDLLLQTLEHVMAAAPAPYTAESVGGTRQRRAAETRRLATLLERGVIRPGPEGQGWVLAQRGVAHA